MFDNLVGRLNGVVSLVTVFEELSHVTSPFWSRDKVNRGIRLFHEPVEEMITVQWKEHFSK